MRKLLVVVLAAAASAACSSSSGGTTGTTGGTDGTGGTGGNGATGGGTGTGGTDGGTGGAMTAACTGKMAQPLDATWTISFGGLDRTFDVHVPASYDPTKATPVVLNFHGFTSNSQQQNFLAKMDDKSDAAGFIAVQPNGTGNPTSWNAGACCGQAVSDNVDDIGFVRAMLDKLEADLCVDANRVYATGMSNGGFLSNRIGCELADRIAAVAPVAGVTGVPTCNPSRPMPVMHFHGTADGLVPYNGNAQMGFIPVPQSFADWGKRDGCTDTPVETFRNGDSHCSTYQQCSGGVEVTLCTVENGGHTWPGGTPVPSLGYTTTDLVATDAMWTFFMKHPLK